ncbi:hypothetical protein MKW98_022632 [Papaver atlanticum]|uniref:BRCT domain-containing protein n=1 Tax=Papaver atlanticum TaxID=357466 RepID=A0AAD4XR93_9MAGN|nr:hypothetical protein MKW98_022632 [Papaver atlanticum]
MGKDYEGGSESKIFDGVRFALLGFSPSEEAQVKSKLINGGGANVGGYDDSSCTHVIVDKIAYDDHRCVNARIEGKSVVNSVWVDHGLNIGAPVELDSSSSILYRPVKDLNGIVGAESFVVCPRGYKNQDRENIMRMVSMMGANFSKPLLANKVTHLIFAKKLQKIKLVNHRWLEDSETVVEDSEDEAEKHSDKVENVTDSSFELHTGSGISTSKTSKWGRVDVLGSSPKLIERSDSLNLKDAGCSQPDALNLLKKTKNSPEEKNSDQDILDEVVDLEVLVSKAKKDVEEKCKLFEEAMKMLPTSTEETDDDGEWDLNTIEAMNDTADALRAAADASTELWQAQKRLSDIKIAQVSSS